MRNTKKSNITKVKSANGGNTVGHRNNRGDTKTRFGVKDDPQRQDQKAGGIEDNPEEYIFFISYHTLFLYNILIIAQNFINTRSEFC